MTDYQEANKLLPKGVRLRYAYTLRTFAEQAEIYAQGRTKPGKIVSNAKAGYSLHQYGVAFDIVILYDKNGDGTFETASWSVNKDWMKVANFLKSRGWEWGGDWKKFVDYPHFQMAYGFTASQLLARHNAKDFIPGTNYVRI